MARGSIFGGYSFGDFLEGKWLKFLMIVELGHVLLKGVKLINFFIPLGLYSLGMSSPLIMVVILWPGWRGFLNSIHFPAEGMI
jgi:hypothetical protein